jgi:hypothetical protein
MDDSIYLIYKELFSNSISFYFAASSNARNDRQNASRNEQTETKSIINIEQNQQLIIMRSCDHHGP